MRHQARITGEVRQIDGDLDRLAKLVLAQAIPEMLESELAITLRQPRIEDQLQGADEVALADLVLTDNDDALASLDIDIREVGEIAYFYS